ncbi:tRNA lysidine(34) synthetase TilS [Corynebacterium sp. H113]|uniref:tRNA lysidine(34) synthetase TilS n=1 Tax=Corynebacterium sp. H113 TaxID=3133419 RepID=UPI0030B0D4C0
MSTDPRAGWERSKPFWPRRSPAFTQVRHAVASTVQQAYTEHGGIVVGLSGGADSLALVAACCAELRSADDTDNSQYAPVHAVIIDHGLQSGSAGVAHTAAEQAQLWGASTRIVRVAVAEDGAGPEAAARIARHEALHAVATNLRRPLLLAHTLDDQAETMLLRLARGGGPAALSGIRPIMRWENGVTVHRPLLALRRTQTLATCAELGVVPWHDPHNHDDSYARVRVRHSLLPVYEELLGPGVAENLAHTADTVRDDNAALDDFARRALPDATTPATDSEGQGSELVVGAVVKQPRAVRLRMYQQWIREHPDVGELGQSQLCDIDAMATNYHGQGPVAVPQRSHFSSSSDAVSVGTSATELQYRKNPRLVVARKGGTLAVLWI